LERQELVSFGKAVRYHRLQRSLSQEALAERSELHRTYVSGIETGDRNIGLLNVYRLAKALGISAPELLATAETLPATQEKKCIRPTPGLAQLLVRNFEQMSSPLGVRSAQSLFCSGPFVHVTVAVCDAVCPPLASPRGRTL
jgi:transcriptional regulator with XRE-family HTH domain